MVIIGCDRVLPLPVLTPRFDDWTMSLYAAWMPALNSAFVGVAMLRSVTQPEKLVWIHGMLARCAAEMYPQQWHSMTGVKLSG